MRLVKQASPKIDAADVLEQGLKIIEFANGSGNETSRYGVFQVAVDLLKTVSAPEFRMPRAAYEIGHLYYQQGMKALKETALFSTLRFKNAHDFFQEAIPHMRAAARMPDYQRNLIPARAKEMLAVFHDNGLMCENELVAPPLLENVDVAVGDFDTAIQWRRMAANEGLADAQWNLGLMYYRGEGTKRSLPQAFRYLSKAYENKAHLTYSQESELAVTIDDVVEEMSYLPTPAKSCAALPVRPAAVLDFRASFKKRQP